MFNPNDPPATDASTPVLLERVKDLEQRIAKLEGSIAIVDPNVIHVPWVYLSLGDHAPRGQRPIYFRGLHESGAHIVGYANAGDGTEIVSAACEAYNREKNQAGREQ